MTPSGNCKTGQSGERIAQHVLKTKGFRMEALNWRVGRIGEIDLIAYHPQAQVLAFVEVKSRKSLQHGTPAESVGRIKQQRMAQLAELYLAQHPPADSVAIRFDVISVFYPGGGKPAEITHLENAFGMDD